MSSVTFSPSVGGDGSTVTDDSNATTGLDGGGHRTRFVPALAQVVAVAANTVTKAGEAAASAGAAASSASSAADQVGLTTAAGAAQVALAAAHVATASAQATAALTQANNAATSASAASASATAAATAANNAVAVVTGGTGSLIAAPGKLPLADAEGKLDTSWFTSILPLFGPLMPQILFGYNEPGAFYDPSDMSTLFQDSAGTVPVTAVEQPVGRILDKSGRGNHATQATTTKRPVLSRRVNQMPSSSGVGVAPWQIIAGNASSTLGTGVLPVVTSGVTTLDGEPVNQVILSLAGGTTDNDRSGMLLSTSVVGPFSVCIKSLNATPSATVAEAIGFNTGGTKSIVSLTDGWVRIDGMTSFGTTVRVQLLGTGGLDYADFLIGKASLTLATDAHLPYQWVNTATDYDADPAKFPAYLRFDGVDDALQTGNINFTSTDKMTVWAGISVSSSSDQSGLFELGANSTTSNGLAMQCMVTPFTTLRGQAFGTSRGVVDASGFALNTLYQVCAQYDLSAALVKDEIRLRKNGVYVGLPTLESSGTGNFSSYPLTIMTRGYMIAYTGGRLYSLIVRGAKTPLSQIEATELYIKQKMRMP